MSESTMPEPLPKESPLLWPALALLVIAVAAFTVFWDGHRYLFPYATAHHAPANWPPPPAPLAEPSK